MSEPLRKLQVVTSEQGGFCNRVSGVCQVPAGQPPGDGAGTAGPPATPASRDVSNPVS